MGWRNVENNLGSLPPAQRKIAEYMLKNKLESIFLTALQLGKNAGSSEASNIAAGASDRRRNSPAGGARAQITRAATARAAVRSASRAFSADCLSAAAEPAGASACGPQSAAIDPWRRQFRQHVRRSWRSLQRRRVAQCAKRLRICGARFGQSRLRRRSCSRWGGNGRRCGRQHDTGAPRRAFGRPCRARHSRRCRQSRLFAGARRSCPAATDAKLRAIPHDKDRSGDERPWLVLAAGPEAVARSMSVMERERP